MMSGTGREAKAVINNWADCPSGIAVFDMMVLMRPNKP